MPGYMYLMLHIRIDKAPLHKRSARHIVVAEYDFLSIEVWPSWAV